MPNVEYLLSRSSLLIFRVCGTYKFSHTFLPYDLDAKIRLAMQFSMLIYFIGMSTLNGHYCRQFMFLVAYMV